MKENKIIRGLLGILCGFIFSLPWIFCYMYLNLMVSYLAIIIGFGIIFGYKLLNKEVSKSKSMGWYLFLSAIFIILIDTLVIIPILLLKKQGTIISLNYMKYIYSTSQFKTAIIRDSIIAVIFTIIGVLPVYNSLKSNREISNKAQDFNEFKEKVKEIFAKYNAFDKKTAVSKDTIKKEINELNLKNTFINLDLMKGIIIKSGGKGKWYYCEKNDDKNNTKVKNAIILVIVFSILSGICIGLNSSEDISSINEIKDTLDSNEKENQELKEQLKIDENNTFITIQLKDNITIELPKYLFKYNEVEQDDSQKYTFLPSNVKYTKMDSMNIFYTPNTGDYTIQDMYNQIVNSATEYGKEETTIENFDLYDAVYTKLTTFVDGYITDVYFIKNGSKEIELDLFYKNEDYDTECRELSRKIASGIRFNQSIE